MKVKIYDTVIQAAADAAAETAQALTEAITDKGSARIVLSTGASQFAYLDALVQQNVDWKQVEMFHLDEYLGLGEEHGASFVRYLKERFVSRVPLKKRILSAERRMWLRLSGFLRLRSTKARWT